MSQQNIELAERLAEVLEAQLGLSCVEWQRTRLAELVPGLALRRPAATATATAMTAAWPELDGSQPGEALHLSRHDLQVIIDHINVGETYFFREPAHFAALLDPVLPERLGRTQGDPMRPLRILSAGCASGEEAYSIAIALKHYRDELVVGRIELWAIDVHAAALEKARRARYSDWALRATPAELRNECFLPDGDGFRLRSALRNLVHFEERNLLEADSGFFRPGSFDVIFCRNVLIYFSDRSLRLAVERLIQALVPGGYLFLGHSESLRGISDAVTLCQVDNAFFYKKKAPPPSLDPVPRASDAGSAPSLVESIQRAADRVAELTSERRPSVKTPTATPTGAEPSAPAQRDEWSALMPVLAQIASAQFDRAQQLLAELPPDAAPPTAATLADAVICCGQGLLEKSQRACHRLLAQSAYAAEAHYLLALCAEQKGDLERARRSYQDAVRTTARFAMAHLRLGALLRRSGQKEPARSALRHALDLLPHEPKTRVLLFGGGFERVALIALCRAELLGLGVEV